MVKKTFNEQEIRAKLSGTTVFVGTPCYGGMAASSYSHAMLPTTMMLQRLGVGLIWPNSGGDSLVTRARNTLLPMFLESKASHLLWIDADIDWRSDDLLRMLLSGKDIVGGIYPKKMYPCEWPMNWAGSEVPICDETGYMEAKDVPTGFMLIRREVIEKLIEAHPEWKCIYNGKYPDRFSWSVFDCEVDESLIYLSEDFAFCRRAQKLGYKTWVDPFVKLGHFGTNRFFFGCIAEQIFPDYSLNIEGWMQEAELTWLREQAKSMQMVAEIGSWKGRTTHALLNACPGIVYAVDHWRGSPEDIGTHHAEAQDGDKVFDAFMANCGHYVNLKVLRGDSAEMGDKAPACIDMVFIDGSHEYEAVAKDLDAWGPKARRLLCGHDWERPSVRRAVLERYPFAELVPGTLIWKVVKGEENGVREN